MHVGSPEGKVIPEKLHDERRIFVTIFREGVELGDGVVERRLCQSTSAIGTIQDLIIEYLKGHALDRIRRETDIRIDINLTEKFNARPRRIGCVGGNSTIAMSLAPL